MVLSSAPAILCTQEGGESFTEIMEGEILRAGGEVSRGHPEEGNSGSFPEGCGGVDSETVIADTELSRLLSFSRVYMLYIFSMILRKRVWVKKYCK